MTLRQYQGGASAGKCKSCGGGGLRPATKTLNHTDDSGRVFQLQEVQTLECPHCGRLSFTLEMADHYSRKLHKAISESSYVSASR